MVKDTGGPAMMGFEFRDGMVSFTSQMTLRDYFAAKAMQSMSVVEKPYNNMETISRISYAMADAMLKERNK